jgi:tRNA U34 2-thiouridine synthase MnmA/TrmU
VNGAPRLPLRVRVRYRHQQPPLPATLARTRTGVVVRFHKPAWAVAPGQRMAVMNNRTVIGSGTMEAPRP